MATTTNANADVAAFQKYAKENDIEANAAEHAKWRKEVGTTATKVEEEAPIEETSPTTAPKLDYDEEKYREELLAQRNASIDKQLALRNSQLQSSYDVGKSQIEGERAGVGTSLAANKESIAESSFDALQMQKAIGAQRGLTPTGVQAAREQGIAREEMSLSAQAQQEADDALAAIDRRITELTMAFESDKSEAQQQALASKQQALADVQVLSSDRQLEIDQFNATMEWNAASLDRQIEAATDSQERQALIDEKAAATNQAYTKENLAIAQEYAVANGQQEFLYDIEKMNLSNSQQLNMLKLSQEFEYEMNLLDFDHQVTLANMSYANQRTMLSMSHANTMEVMAWQSADQERFLNLETQIQADFMKMEQADRIEIMGLEDESKTKFFNMETSRQKDIMDYAATLDEEAMQKEIDRQMSNEVRAAQIDLITSNENFTMAPEYSASIWNAGKPDEQMELFDNYLGLIGMTYEQKVEAYAPLEDYYINLSRKMNVPAPPRYIDSGASNYGTQMSNYINSYYGYDGEGGVTGNYHTIDQEAADKEAADRAYIKARTEAKNE